MSKNVPAAKPTKSLTASAFLARLRAAYNVEHYGLAVSGGADSMALLYLASQAQHLKGAPRFTVFTVDHGLRPEARAEVKMVARVSRQLGLPCTRLQWTTSRSGAALQERARDARYALMADACQKKNIEALVTAHHAVDQMETLLMRVARGTDLTGLRGMQLRRRLGEITLLRPFLDRMPEELAALCHRHEIPFTSDPSNDDLKFERVRWRQTAKQIFANGVSAEKLALTLGRLEAVDDDIETMADEFLRQEGVVTQLGFADLPRAAFVGLPLTLKKRILGRLLAWIGGNSYPVSVTMIENLCRAIDANEPAGRTVAGCLVRPRKSSILIGREYAAISALDVPMQNRKILWDGRYLVSCRKEPPRGARIKPLAGDGVAELKRRGVVIDKSIPSGFLHVLPAVFVRQRLYACPLLTSATSFDFEVKAPLKVK